MALPYFASVCVGTSPASLEQATVACKAAGMPVVEYVDEGCFLLDLPLSARRQIRCDGALVVHVGDVAISVEMP